MEKWEFSYQNSKAIIYKGDCIQWLMDNPNVILFRCVIADPPFNKTQNQWDQSIDLNQLRDVIIPHLLEDGTIAIFGVQDFTTDVILAFRPYFRYELIWAKEKGTNAFEANNKPLSAHENIEIFTLRFPHFYNPNFSKGKAYIKIKKANRQGTNYNKDSTAQIITRNEGKRYPTSILSYNKDEPEEEWAGSILRYPRDHANCGIAPTQKPVDLMIDLMQKYTAQNDWILDPYLGSGASIIAALKLGRNIIGIELDANNTQLPLTIARIQKFIQSHKDTYKKPAPLHPNQKSMQNWFPK